MSVADAFPQERRGAAMPRPGSMSRWAGSAVLCASFLINTLALAAPLTALLIYDRVLLNESHATLAILVAGAIGLVLVEAVLRLDRATIISRASAHADFVARNAVIERILRRPVRPGYRTPLTELNGRLSAVGALRELRLAMLVAIVDLPFGIAFLVLIGVIGGWSVALPAGVCAVFLAATGLVALANERALRSLQRVERERGAFAEAVMRASHAITSMTSQLPVTDRFIRHQLDRSGAQRRQGFLDLLSRDLFTSFSQLLIGSVVVAGALTVLSGQLSLGGLAACTLLAGRSLEPFQSCFNLLTLERRARVSRDDIAAIGAPASEFEAAVPVPWSAPPEIHFDTVEVGGPGRAGNLIRAEDVTFLDGGIVAISGDRGCGKTSLGLAFLGQASVEGSLNVGGIDVAGPGAASIRRQAGYIPRVPQLPGGSLIEALTDGSEDVYADVRYLAHLIGLDEAIKRLPAGYDTVIRPDGSSQLTAGVLQQVAICRILAKKPKLIVADDATCVLDAATELRFASVMKMLAGEATIVLLTDRPSLKAVATQRFDIAGGRLIPVPNVVELAR